MKRFISWLLLMCIILSLSPPIEVKACTLCNYSDDNEVKKTGGDTFSKLLSMQDISGELMFLTHVEKDFNPLIDVIRKIESSSTNVDIGKNVENDADVIITAVEETSEVEEVFKTEYVSGNSVGATATFDKLVGVSTFTTTI